MKYMKYTFQTRWFLRGTPEKETLSFHVRCIPPRINELFVRLLSWDILVVRSSVTYIYLILDSLTQDQLHPGVDPIRAKFFRAILRGSTD